MEILIGLLGGVLVGATGIGSGSLIAPLLVLSGYSPAAAVGTGLVSLICSKCTAAELHRRLGHWPSRHTITLTMGGLTGVATSWVGSRLFLRAFDLHWESYWKLILAGALLLTAASLQLPRPTNQKHGLYFNCADRPVLLYLIGTVVGVVVALTSAGSGGLLIPLLLWVTPWETQELAAISNVYGTAVGLASILLYAGNHFLDFRLILLVLAGVLPGVFLGVRLSRKTSRRIFARGIAIGAAYVACTLLIRTLLP
ncbi:MAG: sulfite exporter TauE/SafE family protein [Acidobacteriaceae bacterium]